MKIKIFMLFTAGSFAVAGECAIFTSPIDFSVMRGGYSTWYTDTELIVDLKKKKNSYKSFGQAYKEFDEHVRKEIKEIICEKQKWSGAANYKIAWQQTERTYQFTATFDTFAYR